MKIFGLAGTNGAGKDTIAEVLAEEFGYMNISATEMLGSELTTRGLSHERANKAALSAEWRRQYGMAAVVDRALEQFESSKTDQKGFVVGSIRHPGESDRIHELGGIQIWVDADPKIRYERITSNDRGRVEDQKSFEQFLVEEEREMKPVGDAATLNMGAVKEAADVFIMNNGNDIEAFTLQVKKELAKYL